MKLYFIILGALSLYSVVCTLILFQSRKERRKLINQIIANRKSYHLYKTEYENQNFANRLKDAEYRATIKKLQDDYNIIIEISNGLVRTNKQLIILNNKLGRSSE